MKTTDELREGFLTFFEERGHTRFPSWSLLPPEDDPSTLFISAGMQPLKPYFSGAKEPPAPRFTTVQKVLRAGGKDTDLDQVGLTARHASMFEMLGNFSFGDYFKDGAIDLAWEFVTEQMGLDPDRLWATVFAGDPELGLGEDEVAVQGWLRKGLPRERIVPFPRSDNFWGPAGETGPCGPCSELHLDRGEEYGCGLETCGPNCENCDRYIEFWNLVFMEFDRHADGTLTPLPKQNIDTGMGLERGSMLLQGAESIFDTDGFRLIMDWIARESGVGYHDSPAATKAHRVISDHGRGMTFLVAEGVTPSNEGRGYVLRRLIRRAVVQARRIGLEDVYRVTGIVADQVGPWYPEVVEHRETVERVVRAEEERFRETLERGLKVFEELAGRDAITGEEAFTLAATHGFPIELTVELAEERGQAVDVDGYREEMARHREISRAGGDTSVAQAGEFNRTTDFRTEFVGYEKTDVRTQIGALADAGEGRFLAKLRESPFYPAGGGQVSDAGWIESEDGRRAELQEAFRLGDDQVLLFAGEGFEAGQRVHAVVPWAVRYPTMANHTATHLLHKALREVLGDHVRQAGSAVRPDKLRFDFTHEHALTAEEREEVERRVNEQVFRNLPVRAFETTARRGGEARRDDAVRREVRRRRARRRGRRLLARALRRHPRARHRGDRAVRDPQRGLGRLRRAPDRGGDRRARRTRTSTAARASSTRSAPRSSGCARRRSGSRPRRRGRSSRSRGRRTRATCTCSSSRCRAATRSTSPTGSSSSTRRPRSSSAPATTATSSSSSTSTRRSRAAASTPGT